MKRKILSLICMAVVFCCRQGLYAQDNEIELVESVPVETVLDLKQLRNTPEVWSEMIAGAKTLLDIETFYVSTESGEPLDQILKEIANAAGRGVSVRIISEEKFRRTYPEPLESMDKEPNIEVRFIDFEKIAGSVMHAKYFIVDREQVFFGSQNFDWRALKHIHELGVRLKSATIAGLFSKVFEADWKIAESNAVPAGTFAAENYPVPLSFQLSDRSISLTPVFSPVHFIPYENLWDEPNIVALIDSAKNQIDIQLLTYETTTRDGSYYEVLDNALRRAAARGVRVHLLCSDWSKRHPKIDHLKSLAAFPKIQVKLSTIPEYSGGFIPYARVEHCKYAMVDKERFWIGTSNWGEDYFRHGRNVGVIVEDTVLGKVVQQFFDNSWDSPYAYFLELGENYKPPKTNDE